MMIQIQNLGWLKVPISPDVSETYLMTFGKCLSSYGLAYFCFIFLVTVFISHSLSFFPLLADYVWFELRSKGSSCDLIFGGRRVRVGRNLSCEVSLYHKESSCGISLL